MAQWSSFRISLKSVTWQKYKDSEKGKRARTGRRRKIRYSAQFVDVPAKRLHPSLFRKTPCGKPQQCRRKREHLQRNWYRKGHPIGILTQGRRLRAEFQIACIPARKSSPVIFMKISKINVHRYRLHKLSTRVDSSDGVFHAHLSQYFWTYQIPAKFSLAVGIDALLFSKFLQRGQSEIKTK